MRVQIPSMLSNILDTQSSDTGNINGEDLRAQYLIVVTIGLPGGVTSGLKQRR